MALIKHVVRVLLFLHGLSNVAQGIYCVLRPVDWAAAAGQGFVGAPDKAIQSIGWSCPLHMTVLQSVYTTDNALGLGSIGVGVYGAWGASTSYRRFFLITLFLRMAFATIAFQLWGWDSSSRVVMYEVAVAFIAALGAIYP